MYSRERGQPVSVAGPPSLCIEVKGAARACGGIARRKGGGRVTSGGLIVDDFIIR